LKSYFTSYVAAEGEHAYRRFTQSFILHASAKLIRRALLIANNQGDDDEVELLYAQSDDRKMADVLGKYGDFKTENITLLVEQSADRIRDAIVTTNYRIRQEIQDGDEVLFDVSIDDKLDNEGTVFITSSSANEDSQESDQYEGSIFTHHLLSGLLGAADESQDDRISLSEAYKYAHEQTIRTTSHTWVGTQHPTYRYDIKGKGDVIITRLDMDDKNRSLLEFVEPGQYLVMKGFKSGPVVAELISSIPGRKILLRPGRYFVRQRGKNEIREGVVHLRSMRLCKLDVSRFDRIRYARLVRKGASKKLIAHGPLLFYKHRSAVIEGYSSMGLFGVGYPVSLKWLTITPTLAFGHDKAFNNNLPSTLREIDGVIEIAHVMDYYSLSFSFGLEVGFAHFSQNFSKSQVATTDHSYLSFLFGGAASITLNLSHGFFASFSLGTRTYLLKTGRSDDEIEKSSSLTYLLGFSIGRSF
jgi:hypothetical protein